MATAPPPGPLERDGSTVYFLPLMPLPKIKLWLALAIAFYALGHLLWYLGSPLGQSPVLDGRENLIVASQIADGTLPKEPFYRAMLYPALLAALPVGHAAIGLLAHLANALLVYFLARRFWASESGALISAALVGFNPVLLHFAFDPLDITLAIALFLGSMAALQKSLSLRKSDPKGMAFAGAAGCLIALATLSRPHFVTILVALMAVACAAALLRRIDLRRCSSFLLMANLPLLAYGLIQKSHSNQFQILPWQGAYNLWVSNNGNANGLYFTQSMEFHYLGEHQNPTRLESERLYEAANGELGTIAQRNSYWRSRAIEHVLSEPIDWIKLELYKLYAVFNSFEQYNNKTYSFHKSLSPWLRYNPISWGLLLIAAAACCAFLWRQKRSEFITTFYIAGAFIGGLLIYMASARFRLPLVPILAVLAGGLPFAIAAIPTSSWRLRRRMAISAGVAGILAFTTFGNINSKSTYIQDAMLLADASARVGDDKAAIRWANLALELAPDKQAPKRLRLISRYNLAASGQVATDRAFWRDLANDAEAITMEDQRLSFTRGVVLWNIGDRAKAQQVWHGDYKQHGLDSSASLAALLLTDPARQSPPISAELLADLTHGPHALLGFALAQKHPDARRDSFLAAIAMPEQRYRAIGESLQRVLPSH